MTTKAFMLFLSSLLTLIINAQLPKPSLNRQEAYSYANLVGNYLDAHDQGIITKTELVMMFLETDTIGRITKVHLMAENQEDKSLYGVLKGITPEYFNNKRIIYNAREKTIIFPIYSMKCFADGSNYLDKMRTPWCPFFTEDHSATVKEGMDFIQVNGTTHVVGCPIPEKPPVCDEPEPVHGSDKEAIYATVLSHFYGKPASIFITDSTENFFLVSTDYAEMAKWYKEAGHNIYFDKAKMDSTWILTLIEANKIKHTLTSTKLPLFKPRCVYIRFVTKDSIRKATRDMGHYRFENVFKVRDRVSLSSIILIGNRAIVEISRTCGSLCGDGWVYFLEKKNGKWIIATQIQLWIS